MGEKLRSLRNQQGMTVEQLASKVGVSASYITKIVGEPKSKAGNRTLPADISLINELREYIENKDRSKHETECDLVFCTKIGKPIPSSSFSYVFNTIRDKAGILKDITPHSLRHTFITNCVDAGIPLQFIQMAAGHASPKQTSKYTHLSINMLSKHMKKLHSRTIAGEKD